MHYKNMLFSFPHEHVRPGVLCSYHLYLDLALQNSWQMMSIIINHSFYDVGEYKFENYNKTKINSFELIIKTISIKWISQ